MLLNIPIWVETLHTRCLTRNSRVAQRKRAGPITQRSVDRNYPLLHNNSIVFIWIYTTVQHLFVLTSFQVSSDIVDTLVEKKQQSGAEDACLAHNTEFGKSKLPLERHNNLPVYILLRTTVQHLYVVKYSHLDLNIIHMLLKKKQQSGAEEACWAHNPEVGRSKLPSATYQFDCLYMNLQNCRTSLCSNFFPS